MNGGLSSFFAVSSPEAPWNAPMGEKIDIVDWLWLGVKDAVDVFPVLLKVERPVFEAVEGVLGGAAEVLARGGLAGGFAAALVDLLDFLAGSSSSSSSALNSSEEEDIQDAPSVADPLLSSAPLHSPSSSSSTMERNKKSSARWRTWQI